MAVHANRLAGSTSPYLLQHAHNPVDWYPWGPEALVRARLEDKPLLLSIGYSACHWCHVMAHESFEDEAIAELMNAHFVNVKVDREERPDLDEIYMAATLAMNHGHGGWPMTVFLTPDQQPFFAGTYFPPADSHGRPGFPSILRRIAELWRDSRPSLQRVGEELSAHLRESTAPAPGAVDLDAAIERATDQLAATFDSAWGGFGRAPKFPPATLLRLLLLAHRRGDARALPMVRRTLDGMAHGGMYDQIGGGFCRYSTDDMWLVPHFEKMLYDNALLARAYLEGYQATADPFYRQVATEILDYVVREMTAPEGGFYSATDADSEGEEGKFFVWTPDEVRSVLGDEAAPLALAWFDISADGNWEGRSIPRTPRPLAEVAARFRMDVDTATARLAEARSALYAARGTRVKPGLDDKILTAWNGLMIGVMAEGGWILGEPRWLDAGARAADFVLDRLRANDGRLLRSWRAGTAHLNGYLEDYAFLGNGLLDLYEAGGGARFLDEAQRVTARLRSDFAAQGGGFFTTSAEHEILLVRHREGHDGAVPAANAAAAHLLARLAAHEGRNELRAAAEGALQAWGAAMTREPRAFAESLIALAFLREGPVELAFIGPAGDAGLEALRREVARHFLPHRILGHHDPAAGASTHPLLRGKTLVDGRAALYVCQDFTCRRPVMRPEEVSAALAAPRGSPNHPS